MYTKRLECIKELRSREVRREGGESRSEGEGALEEEREALIDLSSASLYSLTPDKLLLCMAL